MINVLYYLIAGTRGGVVRSRILKELEKNPYNAHILSKKLSLDYKTIKHHIDIFLKHKIIIKEGKYGGIYFISEEVKPHLREIW